METLGADIPSFLTSGVVLDNRYRVQRLVGSGGVGWVLAAEDTSSIGQQLALKIMYPHIFLDDTAITRFHREALLTMRLTHPNIVQTFGVGEIENFSVYLVLEFLPGKSLREANLGTTEDDTFLRIRYLTQVASAVDFAHRAGVIHRDLKPDNILLANTRTIKVADFGLASCIKLGVEVTQVGQVLGTPLYMSPEQFRGELIDARTDMYSFGILAFELFANRHPFEANSFYAIAESHCNQPLPLDVLREKNVPPIWIEIIATCCQKDRAARFESMKAIVDKLRSAFGQENSFESMPLIAVPLGDASVSFRRNKLWRRILNVLLVVFILTMLTILPLVVVQEELSPHTHARAVSYLLRFEQKTGYSFPLYRKSGMFTARLDEPTALSSEHYVYSKQLPLLYVGIDPNFSDPTTGMSPLHAWLRRLGNENRSTMVDALLTHGADPHFVDETNRSAMDVALKLGDEFAIEAFLDAGASSTTRSADGRSPLSKALRMRQTRIVRLLMKHDADPLQVDFDGQTPMNFAVENSIREALILFSDNRAK